MNVEHNMTNKKMGKHNITNKETSKSAFKDTAIDKKDLSKTQPCHAPIGYWNSARKKKEGRKKVEKEKTKDLVKVNERKDKEKVRQNELPSGAPISESVARVPYWQPS